MTKRQEELLEQFGLLIINFPDSKTMCGNVEKIVQKNNCEIFTKEKYTHQEYYDITKNMKDADKIDDEEYEFLGENIFILKRYSIQVMHNIE